MFEEVLYLGFWWVVMICSVLLGTVLICLFIAFIEFVIDKMRNKE